MKTQFLESSSAAGFLCLCELAADHFDQETVNFPFLSTVRH